MRVSSLSDSRVIPLVSKYFVPVFFSRDRYQQDKVSPEEAKFIARIDSSRRAKKLEGGAVCVYLATASGDVFATLPVQKASKPDLLAAFLKKTIDDKQVKPMKPSKGAERPAAKAKSVSGRLFAVRTRFDAGENRGTSSETVELTKDEWLGFIPPETAKAGRTWKVPREVVEKLLRQAYPPLPHWNAKLAKMDSCQLMATVKSNKDGDVTVRLEGSFDLIFPHKGEPTDGRVKAKLVGVVRCDAKEQTLASVELASDGATYVSYWQNKAQTKATSIAVELLE
jgi:hypothetical protein